MSFKIIPLSEGSFSIDKSKVFVPFNTETDDLQKRPVGSILVEVQPFCIVADNDIIVIDAGLGFKKNGVLQLFQLLRDNDIDPDKVTKVLMSHLHKDHAGAVATKDILGNRKLSFKNATYYVQRREYEYAEATGFPSYFADEFEALDRNPQVEWLHDDKGQIGDRIFYEVTGAHSKYHQVFTILLEGKTIFFGGDDAPQLQQMKSKFVAKYDFDGKKCMELRQLWWEKGQKENWIFLFYHDVKTPVYPQQD